MNFFDTYDVSGTATPPPDTQPTQSLNDEVSEVVGQLSRFWGGFRKQSQVAFEAARKDLGSVVQQAQKELTKLAAESPAESATSPEASTSSTEQAASASSSADVAPTPSSSVDSSSSDATDKADPDAASSPSQSSQTQTIFSRLQASLPPALANVQSQLPETLKETLKHARVGSANLTALDFAQLRSTIAIELQRVQGATEEYVHRSEDFLREAGEFLKDAVKVVPPEEGDSGYSGLIWDGTDVWMLPTTSGSVTPSAAPGSSGKGKEREAPGSAASLRPSVDSLRAVATRAESMLKQLRHDPEVIKADPKDDANVRDMYTNWLATEAASEDRGLGTTAWQNKIERALADPVDGIALKATMDTLAPETLTYDEFWTRYFFRVHQVEREEARRKAIIQGTTENEEEFSWEDDDEETVSPTMKLPPTPSLSAGADQSKLSAAPPGVAAPEARSIGSTPANLSPRQSSEESYDVVSSQVSNSGTVDGSAGKAKVVAKKAEEEEEEDDDEEEDDEDDEDEEDDDDEEEDDEDEEEGDGGEEEEDSDWE